MDALNNIFSAINGVVWGPVMLVLLLGVGIYLQIGLKIMPIRKLGMGFKLMWGGRDSKASSQDEGEISPFNALMTALSATIGTGNIAGVATAIALGGPGAVFWMWITALVGMATKFAEAVLAVRYRETDENGFHIGGRCTTSRTVLAANGCGWVALSPSSAPWPPLVSVTRCSRTPSPMRWIPALVSRTGSPVW